MLQALGLVPSQGRALAEGWTLAMLAWLPFALLAGVSSIRNRELDPYFRDLTLHARFLLAVPLVHVGSSISVRLARQSVHRLADEGFGDRTAFEPLASTVGAWMEERGKSAILLVVSVLLGQALLWGAIQAPLELRQAAAQGEGMRRIWVEGIGFPIFYFVGLRAILSWAGWCGVLAQLRRVSLRLFPAHPDYCGGLEFLVLPCRAFCLVILGFSCILVGDWGAEIAFDAADVSEFGGLLGAWAVTAVLSTLGPLVLVSPRLLEARLRGLREFGALATSYTRLFEERWIRRVPDRPLLGTPDLQSLADLGNSFRVVREMRVILVRKRDVLLVLLASVGPALPLLLTKFPLAELLERLFLTVAR